MPIRHYATGVEGVAEIESEWTGREWERRGLPLRPNITLTHQTRLGWGTLKTVFWPPSNLDEHAHLMFNPHVCLNHIEHRPGRYLREFFRLNLMQAPAVHPTL